ncbi:MAG: CTP synthase [Bacillota bacterium]|jgi:CTP synthase|nr:CTP synthase [Candidatus Fermentithermobacillaceae bacterium]
MSKHIFITGGVVSGLGKGITAASIGTLLQARGHTVTIMKMDPYVNVDAGTMSPLQHGEIFVTDDGAETDLDLGHYERFIDRSLTGANNITTGQVYGAVIASERRGGYNGSTVQVIPHVTNEIKDRIRKVAAESQADIVLVEVGGTVGDIESLPFLEAIRQFRTDVGADNTAYIHVTLIPHLPMTGELKTKPTQHSVAELRSIGIQPDIIVCRSSSPLSADMKEKIALFCNVEVGAVISNLDAGSIYEVPVMLETEGLGKIVEKQLNLPPREPDLTEWQEIAYKITHPKRRCNIAIVGKYVSLHDAYKSVAEALHHGGLANDACVDILWIDSDKLSGATDEQVDKVLENAHGILVPGGSGRGSIEGKLKAIRWARENQVPFFGICLGLQCAVIEIARNVMGLEDANSTEFDPDTSHPVVDLTPEQKELEHEGHARTWMRRGLYECHLKPGSIPWKAYGVEYIEERHRHRFEINPMYVQRLAQAGFEPVGIWPARGLIEILERQGHPWFLGTQFHPELLSRPNRPHPLFREFVAAALRQAAEVQGQ